MSDLDLAQQLVRYVDATTEPVTAADARTPDEQRNGVSVSLDDRAGSEPARGRWLLAVAAVAVLGLVGAIVFAGTRSSGGDEDPADQPIVTVGTITPDVTVAEIDDTAEPTLDPLETAAVDAAAMYFSAFAAGDGASVAALSDMSTLDPNQETELVQWWAQAAWPGQEHPGWPSAACEVSPPASAPDRTRAECPIRVGDPVAEVLGITALMWHVEVAADGAITREVEPVTSDLQTYASVLGTYRDYIDLFEPPGADGCDPSSYDPGSVWTQNGIPLTGDCGELFAAVADDVAEWMLAGSAVPSAAQAFTDERLHGYWLNTAGFTSLFVDFRRDGTFTSGKEGRLGDGAFAGGTYEVIADDTIALALECGDGIWTWTGTLSANGVMEVVATAPGCGPEWEGDWDFTRVSPSSPAGRRLLAGDLDVEPDQVTDVTDINGLWLRVGTGDVLAVDPDGTYLLTQNGDTLAPLDTGTVSVVSGGHGVVRFVTEGSGRCDLGDTWTWSGVTIALDLLRENDPRGTTMRAVVDPLCATKSGGGPWRLLAPEKFAAG